MDSQKMKQLVEDGSSSSSNKKVDGVKAPTKLFDLNLLPEDSEEEEEDDDDDDDEFYIEIFGSVDETSQVDLNLPNNEVVEANSNSNELVVPQFPTSGGDNNISDASIIFNNTTTTTSSATKMVTPSHHPFDDKRKLVRPNDGSSTSCGAPKSLRPRQPEPNHGRRICTNYNCRTRNTPMWRKGPLGPKTLCNACGIQYKKQVSSRGSDLV